MILLGFIAFCIIIWALVKNPVEEPIPESNPISEESNPISEEIIEPEVYEMDPIDAPPVQIIKSSPSDDYIKVENSEVESEPNSDEIIGAPKHLRTASYEDKKSGLAAIFDNVKPKND
jgi:hypothetical protein